MKPLISSLIVHVQSQQTKICSVRNVLDKEIRLYVPDFQESILFRRIDGSGIGPAKDWYICPDLGGFDFVRPARNRTQWLESLEAASYGPRNHSLEEGRSAAGSAVQNSLGEFGKLAEQAESGAKQTTIDWLVNDRFQK